jgi:hypothetical protein
MPFFSAFLQLQTFRAAVAKTLALPLNGVDLERIKLATSGIALIDDAAVLALHDGATVLAVVAPKAPSKELSKVNRPRGETESDSEDEWTRVPVSSLLPWQRSLVAILRRKLRVPEALISIVYRAGWKFWAIFLVWIAGSKVAALYEWGPVYWVLSLLAFMALNLGHRQAGELSAYSIFNPDFYRLPGQLTAEDLDGQVRRRRIH